MGWAPMGACIALFASGAMIVGGGITVSPGTRVSAPFSIVAAPAHVVGPLDRGSPGFDKSGNAYLRDGTDFVVIKKGSKPRVMDLTSAAGAAIDRDIFGGKGLWDRRWDTGRMIDTAVVVDDSDRVYTVLTPKLSNLKTAILLMSDDGGTTWRATPLRARTATIERYDSFNDHGGPPTILSFENFGPYTGPQLWLETFKISDNGLQRRAPAALVSNNSFVVPNHSGGGNLTFTLKDKIFVVFDTLDKSAPGTEALGRTFDRTTGEWTGGMVSLGRSTTVASPDDHDLPAITMDRSGTLTVVLGAHHAHFKVLQSLLPQSMSSGWSPPVTIGQSGRDNGDRAEASFSYTSLNTALDGTVNIVARAEGTSFYNLVQFRKPPGQSWAKSSGGIVPRLISSSGRHGYAAWRQQVTADRAGRLYLNFVYYANNLSVAEAAAGGVADSPRKDCVNARCWYINAPSARPITLVSDDNGETWK
ncbi:hypothetical protein SAMN03159340_04063 [Sphingomonas sp. NFR15]|nr:hypothetical protein SAMN03159340_04063 [Sphingomonas sp. NFR15]